MATRKKTTPKKEVTIEDLTEIGLPESELEGLIDLDTTEVESAIEDGDEQELLEEDDPKEKECQTESDQNEEEVKVSKNSSEKPKQEQEQELNQETLPSKKSEDKNKTEEIVIQPKPELKPKQENVNVKSVNPTVVKKNINQVQPKNPIKIPTGRTGDTIEAEAAKLNVPDTSIEAIRGIKSVKPVQRSKDNSLRSSVGLFTR